jgi:hypothetical protein
MSIDLNRRDTPEKCTWVCPPLRSIATVLAVHVGIVGVFLGLLSVIHLYVRYSQ